MSSTPNCACHLGQQLENRIVYVYDPQLHTIEEKKLFSMKHDWTILFFYPADFSVVCPTELQALHEHQKVWKEHNTKVYVISRDSIYVHKQRIASEKKLKNFALEMVSDREGEFGKLLNIIDQTSQNYQRATIIVDKSGCIQSIELVGDKVGRNIEELARKIKAMSYVRHHPHVLCPEHRDDEKPSLKETIKAKKSKKKLFTNHAS